MPQAPTLTLTLAAALVTLGTWIAPRCAPAQRYAGAPSAGAGAQPVDECQVIARVDGDVILAGEVLWQVNMILEEAAGQFPPDQEPQIRKQLMARQLTPLLDDQMVYADFRRQMGAKIDMAAIHKDLDGRFEENEIPRLIKVLGVENRDALAARLLELGTTLQTRRQSYYRTAIAQFWLRQSIEQSGRVNKHVTPQELLAYYREHIDEYEYPTQARWEEMMVSFSECGSRDEALKRIVDMGNEAYKLAVQATDASKPIFTEIAKARSHGYTASEGGVHDWTSQGSLADTALDEALFKDPATSKMSLRPGEMSVILTTDRGYHIVRVLERKLAGRTPFTEVQREIRTAILNERMERAIKEKLAEMRSSTRFWTAFTGPLDRSISTALRDAGEVQ